MKFVEFNGDKISKLSLGTVQFGLNYGISNNKGQPSQQEVNEIIDYVIGKGINCFDTAQAYGSSEKVLGEAIKSYDNLFVVSKIKSEFFNDDLVVSNSLKNLNIPHLYALLLHDSEILKNWNLKHSQQVETLIKSGKIKYFGVSIYTDDEFKLAIENSAVKVIQIPFNLFDQRAIKNNWLKMAEEANKLIFIRSVFLQGLFFIEELPSHLKDAERFLDKVSFYADKLQISKSELALNFVNSVAKNSILLFGCEDIKQAEENIENFNSLKKFSSEIINELVEEFSDVDEKIYNPVRWNNG